MPRADVRCPQCGLTLEVPYPAQAPLPAIDCPRCPGPPRMERVWLPGSAPGFVLKGAGFHQNDYPKG